MGVISPQMVICICHDREGNAKDELDDFVKATPDLFVRSGVLTNGVINYVMFWDGSKEGWNESDRGDELRDKFLDLVKELTYAEIYKIDHFENYQPTLSYQHISNMGVS